MPEDAEAKSPIAVLSYGLWQRRFGARPDIVGQSITLNGVPFSVVGVMPASFQFHIKQRSGTGRPAELWSVLPMPVGPGANDRGRFLSVVGRLKPGVSAEQANAEMRTIASRLSAEAPQYNRNYTAEVLPLREQFFGNVRRALWLPKHHAGGRNGQHRGNLHATHRDPRRHPAERIARSRVHGRGSVHFGSSSISQVAAWTRFISCWSTCGRISLAKAKRSA